MKEVMNITKAIEQCDNDEEFMREMVELFREDLQECIDLLDKAFHENDLTQLKELSHRIKGQAATLAAEDLLKISRSIEHASSCGDVRKDDYVKLVDAINVFLDKTSNM